MNAFQSWTSNFLHNYAGVNDCCNEDSLRNHSLCTIYWYQDCDFFMACSKAGTKTHNNTTSTVTKSTVEPPIAIFHLLLNLLA